MKQQNRIFLFLWNYWYKKNRVREGERARTPAEPLQDVLKINSDARFDVSTRNGGWGFIIQNHLGVAVQSGMGKLEYLMDALHAETIACLTKIRIASEMCMEKVITETDCLVLKIA